MCASFTVIGNGVYVGCVQNETTLPCLVISSPSTSAIPQAPISSLATTIHPPSMNPGASSISIISFPYGIAILAHQFYRLLVTSS
mmetsp:Transcript_35406/g.47531  ORF Transcript_35406/g.47531 Transcript_35406/m.47531 type:complete len:85 (-) Transcript_35406:686-940(-)